MRKILSVAAVAFAFSCLMPAPAAQAIMSGEDRNIHRVGLGVNYWKTIDNIDQNVNSDGFSYLASYQYSPIWYFKVGADLEYYPDLANSNHPVLAPELYLLFGGIVYGGVGTGIYYHDGNWGSEPFYMFRAGFDIPIVPRLFLDINANYRFNDWKTLEWSDFGTDTIRLGAAFRFVL